MKLIRFRIKNYKSIKDTNWCELSGDSITILAGQNESGKSNILQALRDFDAPNDLTPSVKPDDEQSAVPEIECCFWLNRTDIQKITEQMESGIPDSLISDFLDTPLHLVKTFPDKYRLEGDVKDLIKELGKQGVQLSSEEIKNKQLELKEITESKTSFEIQLKKEKNQLNQFQTELANNNTPENQTLVGDCKTRINQLNVSINGLSQSIESIEQLLNPEANIEVLEEQLVGALLQCIPDFVYFDSFEHRLPKKIYLAEIQSDSADAKGIEAVRDFITLSGLDINKLPPLSDIDDKQIDNYLSNLSATVTGDFLGYWSQSVDGKNKAEIEASLKHDDQGYYLAFFVREGTLRRFPEQRSKGFLWFLSFYLRLNALSIDHDLNNCILLIDEPGSYLHSHAQRDILKLFENDLSQSHQILFSTHSSDLISPDRLNRIRLVLNRAGKGTLIQKIHSSSGGSADLESAMTPIIQAIGASINPNIFSNKQNIVVEGISDYYYLAAIRYLFKLPDSVSIIPVTGASNVNKMVSLLLGWGQKFYIILDGDNAGKKEYKTLSEKLDVSTTQMCMLPDSKSIEDLFSKNDFKTLVLSQWDCEWSDEDLQELSNSKLVAKYNCKEVCARGFFELVSGQLESIKLGSETHSNFTSTLQGMCEYYQITSPAFKERSTKQKVTP